MPKPIKVKVSMTQYDLANVKNKCPIANTLKLSDEDILSPKVDREVIIFSRRSDDMRHWYETPTRAVKFIDAVDTFRQTGRRPRAFWLELDDSLLQHSELRKKRSAEYAVKGATHSNGRKTAKTRRSSIAR